MDTDHSAQDSTELFDYAVLSNTRRNCLAYWAQAAKEPSPVAAAERN